MRSALVQQPIKTSSVALAAPGRPRGRRHVEPTASASSSLSSSDVELKKYTRVRLKTKNDCELGISFYPRFRYNAVGGGGWGTVTHLADGKLQLVFDTSVLVIPDFSYRTASLFGLPIPPPLNITIKPLRLEGVLDQVTGEVNLNFDADFYFSAGPVYSAPPLGIRTLLTTESTQGVTLSGTGRRLVNNAGLLVGTATVARVSDAFMDNFLQLPADALAVMNSEFEFE